jgi:hypothetical protein
LIWWSDHHGHPAGSSYDVSVSGEIDPPERVFENGRYAGDPHCVGTIGDAGRVLIVAEHDGTHWTVRRGLSRGEMLIGCQNPAAGGCLGQRCPHRGRVAGMEVDHVVS